jgi:diguanylate cyclase (GGDEF)-like protein
LSSSRSPELRASGSSWATHQLGEFLSALGRSSDEAGALQGAVELAAGAIEAEIAAILVGDEVLASIGFARGCIPAASTLTASVESGLLEVDGLGSCHTIATPLDRGPTLLLARASSDAFTGEEANLLRAMASSLDLTLRMLRLVEDERRQTEQNAELVSKLQERQLLLERLSRIQRSISARDPLDEVLKSIVAGAAELLGDDVVALHLIDPEDPECMVMVESIGLEADLVQRVGRKRVGVGAGGRAMVEDGVVVVEDYETAEGMIKELAGLGMKSAMAAPVREDGRPVGSLTVATYRADRRYSSAEQEMLIAFADHASLALIDARMVAAVQHQAFHDSLTGLPNRALLLDRLDHALRRARREIGSSVAVLFVDLDRFKVVNDSLGHSAGDELLAAVASRIESCVRDVDTAARLGGDEFAILLEDTEGNIRSEAIVDRVLQALLAPFDISGHTVTVGATIGVAVSRTGVESATELLRNADLAMYQGKAAGGGSRAVFEPSMYEAVVNRLSVEAELERAIKDQEFVLHYQPIVDLETEEIVGVEALVRWEHPTRGLVPPLEFIPLAEETGQIVRIGRWVLHEAVRQAEDWRRLRPPGSPLSVSFNLSPRELQRAGLVDDLRDALRGTGLDPACLVVELTESILLQDTEVTLLRLGEIKELGVRLAIDDFGTGYSSLGYLRRFPIDILKVDRSFVDGIGRNSEASALAAAVVDIGRTLNLDTVAEGIEDDAQLAGLRKMRCKLGQGYHFSRPLSASALEELLRAAKPRRPTVVPSTTAEPTPDDPRGAVAIPMGEATDLGSHGTFKTAN